MLEKWYILTWERLDVSTDRMEEVDEGGGGLGFPAYAAPCDPASDKQKEIYFNTYVWIMTACVMMFVQSSHTYILHTLELLQ